MFRFIRSRTIALVVPMALAATATLAGELRYVEHADHETVIHRTSAEDSLGDLIVFANTLRDAADHATVGASRGSCIRTELGRHWHCTFTLALHDGSLETTGDFADEGDSDFAIIGGTGRHAGAAGSLRIHPRNEQHDSYDFIIKFTHGEKP